MSGWKFQRQNHNLGKPKPSSKQNFRGWALSDPFPMGWGSLVLETQRPRRFLAEILPFGLWVSRWKFISNIQEILEIDIGNTIGWFLFPSQSLKKNPNNFYFKCCCSIFPGAQHLVTALGLPLTTEGFVCSAQAATGAAIKGNSPTERMSLALPQRWGENQCPLFSDVWSSSSKDKLDCLSSMWILFALLMQTVFHEPSLSWCFPFLLRAQTQWMLLSENISCGLFVPLGVFWLRYTTAHHSKMDCRSCERN